MVAVEEALVEAWNATFPPAHRITEAGLVWADASKGAKGSLHAIMRGGCVFPSVKDLKAFVHGAFMASVEQHAALFADRAVDGGDLDSLGRRTALKRVRHVVETRAHGRFRGYLAEKNARELHFAFDDGSTGIAQVATPQFLAHSVRGIVDDVVRVVERTPVVDLAVYHGHRAWRTLWATKRGE